MTVSKRLLKSRLKKSEMAMDAIKAMGIDFDAITDSDVELLEDVILKSQAEDRGLFEFIPDDTARKAYDPLETKIVPEIEKLNPIKILAIAGFGMDMPEETPENCDKLNVAVTKMYLSNCLREVDLG